MTKDQEKLLESTAENTKNILNLLQGNPLDEDDCGLIGVVRRDNERIDCIEEKRKKAKYIYGTIGGVITAAWPVILIYWEKVTKIFN